MKRLIVIGLVICFSFIMVQKTHSEDEKKDRALEEAGFYEDEEDEDPFYEDPFLTSDEEKSEQKETVEKIEEDQEPAISKIKDKTEDEKLDK